MNYTAISQLILLWSAMILYGPAISQKISSWSAINMNCPMSSYFSWISSWSAINMNCPAISQKISLWSTMIVNGPAISQKLSSWSAINMNCPTMSSYFSGIDESVSAAAGSTISSLTSCHAILPCFSLLCNFQGLFPSHKFYYKFHFPVIF